MRAEETIDLRTLAARGPIHFVGIAGAGMSALAEALISQGATVTGCDLHPGELAARFRARGVEIMHGQDASHVDASTGAVITTAAVPPDHPELVAARAAGVPVLKRAQALGALVNRGTVIGIAGTHGKTTTTAMTTAILAEAGLEPTGFVGGRVPGWNSGLRLGGDQLFVVEADEYDRSFLALRPTVAVVTTMEADHLDIYGSFEGVQEAFRHFLQLVPSDGLIVLCNDDRGARELMDHDATNPDVVTYGIDPGTEFRAVKVEVRGRGSRFIVHDHGEELGEIVLGVAGYHNVRNALAAMLSAMHVGASFEAARRALFGFHGVERRFQELGRARGITVIDDYAHHPTEIRATMAAARAAYAGARIVAVFQPHLYSRTRDFAGEFGAELAKADVVWVTDVYAARETPIEGVSGELVAQAAQKRSRAKVHYEPNVAALPERLAAELRSGDVCVLMGAGDIDRAARTLLQTLRSR